MTYIAHTQGFNLVYFLSKPRAGDVHLTVCRSNATVQRDYTARGSLGARHDSYIYKKALKASLAHIYKKPAVRLRCGDVRDLTT